MNYGERVSYEREVQGDKNRKEWWWNRVGRRDREERRLRVKGRDREKRGVGAWRLWWVILAVLKAELLKFRLILANLCFVHVFHVTCLLWVWMWVCWCVSSKVIERNLKSLSANPSLTSMWTAYKAVSFSAQCEKFKSVHSSTFTMFSSKWIHAMVSVFVTELVLSFPTDSNPNIRLTIKPTYTVQLVVLEKNNKSESLIDFTKKPQEKHQHDLNPKMQSVNAVRTVSCRKTEISSSLFTVCLINSY